MTKAYEEDTKQETRKSGNPKRNMAYASLCYRNGKGGYYDVLITIGIHGLPATAALDSERSMATKILGNL